MAKFTSRKFIMAMAAFLASIGGSIAGLATQNEVLAGIGIGCTVASAAIYAAAEAYVDGANVKSSTVSITASTNAKDVVARALATEEAPKEGATDDAPKE